MSPKRNTQDIYLKILQDTFRSLIFGNIINLLVFVIKTTDPVFQAFLKLLDRAILPIMGIYLLRRIDARIKNNIRIKTLSYLIIPIVLIAGGLVVTVDLLKDVIARGPDCQPKSQIMKLYETHQIKFLYDSAEDTCQK